MTAMTEADSIHALAEEVNQTVVLVTEFYSCVMKDCTKSGKHRTGSEDEVDAPAMEVHDP